MYRETLPQTPTTAKPLPHMETSVHNHSKVNRICQAFLDVLLPSMLSTNLQNIVTAYVCKSPPDHDSALLLIAKLREEDAELAERAIEHICFLADANKLYQNALGLYNLELALMVAQQSQKVLYILKHILLSTVSHFYRIRESTSLSYRVLRS